MNILIRADSSSLIGHGHIMRDLVLANNLSKNHNVSFAVRNLEGNINYKITEDRFSITVLLSNTIEELIETINKLKIDLIIIDHYALDEAYEKEIKLKSKVKILALDDTYNKHQAEYILNHNLGASAQKYSNLTPEYSQFFCGNRYTLIRDEFINTLKKKYFKRKVPRKKLTILVMLGGSDPKNITYQVVLELSKNKNYFLNLVTTNSNKNLMQLKNLVKKNKKISLHINSTKIAELMMKADIGIVSASVTASEALFMRLPIIAIDTADNQKAIANYLLKMRLPVMKNFHRIKLNIKIKKSVYHFKNLLNRIQAIHFSLNSLERYL